MNSPVVIGAGTMGLGIAMAFADAGFEVRLIDSSPDSLERAKARIARTYETAVAKGRLTRDQAERRRASIAMGGQTDYADADFVVEAVFEDLALKNRIFRTLGERCSAAAVLASNTSTLDVDAIGAGVTGQERIIGMHFWNPAHVNRALEIVRGSKTAPQTIATVVELGERLGKVPIVVGNCDGFVANRMLFKYIREAELLLEEGASVAEVDRAFVDFGFPMGPLAMLDLAGVDVGWRVRQEKQKRGGVPYRLSRLTDLLHERGRHGQKSGAGFYAYAGGRYQPISDGVVEELAAAERSLRGASKRTPDAPEILERCMWSAVNEGAFILEEGIASSAADIDAIWLYGFGFPARYGGPMGYAEAIGLPHVYEFVRERARSDPEFWRPAPLLERLAARAGSFADFKPASGVAV